MKTIAELRDRIRALFPRGDYSIETRLLKKAPGETLELDVHIWIPGRTFRFQGRSVDEVSARLEAEVMSPRLVDARALDVHLVTL